ncbi:MAG: glycoside hydrolase family 97 catalytic domain-containing protein [Sphingobacteriaceae bacterium]|nr:glycoside hydrolase family 97 catalytic domain-containing protein [Cytophagaceae bacterium]
MRPLVLLLVVCPLLALGQRPLTLTSPDGSLTFRLNHEAGQLRYTLRYKNRPVVEPSLLRLLTNPRLFDEPLRVVSSQPDSHSSRWKPLYGERSEVTDHYNELTINVRSEKATFQLLVRVYNAGLAFQYKFPKQPGLGSFLIGAENSTFRFQPGTQGWFSPTAQAAYRLKPLSAFRSASERPLTLQLPNGLVACLTEAQTIDYPRMKLSVTSQTTVQATLDGPVRVTAPFATPWRVVLVAEQPGQLLENNDLLLNLNAPNALTHTDWIRPGKIMRDVTLSTAGANACVDFAARHGIDYLELDAGWYGDELDESADPTRPIRSLDLPAVLAYARRQGVGVWLYVNGTALQRNPERLLSLYQRWGVAGIKIGYVGVGSQAWTKWLHEAVRQAADHRLMVDIHDEFRPSGTSRTYPNLLTQEGVGGNEQMPSATHNVTLPFTRFVAGAADYTVCYFSQKNTSPKTSKPLQTTPAHQLALPVVFYSPLQFLYWYDRPDQAQDEPELFFFDKVPTIWDDTRVLSGEIGQHVSIARRKGNDWFVGTLTNTEARRVDLSLDFLGEKLYVAQVFRDGGSEVPTRTQVAVDRFLVSRSDVLRADLRPSGGQAVYFTPATLAERRDLPRYASLSRSRPAGVAVAAGR